METKTEQQEKELRKQENHAKFRRIALYVGYAFCGISLAAFLIPELNPEMRANDPFDSAVFFINYALSIVFFLGIMIQCITEHKWKFWKIDQPLYQVSLFLFSLSAFSLNHSITVFSGFPSWLMIFLVFSYSGLLLHPYRDKIPTFLRHITWFLSGTGVAITLYFSVVLAPAMIVGIIGSIVLGMSLHLLAPAFALAEFIRIGVNEFKKPVFYSWITGAVWPMIFLTVFTVSWINVRSNLNEIKANYYENEVEQELPLWAVYGQQAPEGMFTEWILKSEILYQIENNNWFWALDNGRGWRNKLHDPLFVVANTVGGKMPLSSLEAERTVETRVSLKHASQRRLWSGNNLETALVETQTKVYPEYRIAYTEKKLVIKNNLPDVDENLFQTGRQQEAVYTFHLPEGSVATSLSLWIEGEEEQARLTSKTVADSAYETIVGRERRDPSLVHWQEGNLLVVTVFPCTPQEDRIFKLGITTPLRSERDRLLLENIYFEGPTIAHAKEKTEIFFEGKQPNDFMVPHKMEALESGKYRYEGQYKPWWEFAFDAPELSANKFAFNNQVYTAKPLEKQLAKADLEAIYLDIDQSWEQEDFDEIWANKGSRSVFVYEGKLVELTESNKEVLFEKLNDYRFSLFPLYLIENPGNSLFITRSSEYAPDLDALKSEYFGQSLNDWSAALETPLNCFHLGGDFAPYLKSLREFRILNYDRGSAKELAVLLNEDVFPINLENENRVVIHHSRMMIEKDTLTETGGGPAAPDHLARLFAYNDIMRQVGSSFLTDDYITETVVNEAKEAFVVSPVSSMIVLETVEDYDRFGIEENENSLGNASFDGSGEVPEPHEWALMLTVLLLLVFLYRKKLWTKIAGFRK